MEDQVTKIEYDEHKRSCSVSFDNVNDQLNRINRALFGERELEQKGIVEMTREMYASIMYAKTGERIFLKIVKISGAFLTLIAAFWAIIEVFRRIKIQ